QYFLQSYPNLKVESPKTIYLNPKEKYMIPLYISDTYTNKKIYIDFINNEKEFEEKALKLLKIALLDNAKIIVVINNYTIDPDLFDPKRIRLLNIYSKNIEEISKLLINEIEKILKQ
ncbi:MAG TPA: hypothetical protein VKU94_00570, partial [Geobacterales bacterium]|nr:hypothetical protein [Geobacterales bacterium]